MKTVLTYSTLIFLGLQLGCKRTPTQTSTTGTSRTPVEIQFISEHPIDESVKAVITNVVHAYNARYELGFPLLSVIDTNNFWSKEIAETTVVQRAFARPRQIYMDLRGYATADFQLLSNDIAHELFHTLPPFEMKPLTQPRIILDPHLCLGFHGLAVIDEVGGEKTGFRAIEEAAAELCAHKFKRGYTATARDYFGLGVFLREMVDIYWVSAEELIQFQKTNGFEEFCARILKKESASDDDIRLVCTAFQKVRNDEKNIIPMLKELIRVRGETGRYSFSE